MFHGTVLHRSQEQRVSVVTWHRMKWPCEAERCCAFFDDFPHDPGGWEQVEDLLREMWDNEESWQELGVI